MKANELTIGDWVKVNDVEHQHPMRVAEIKRSNGTYYATLYWDGMPEDLQPDHCLAEIEVIEPIPLTPEILEKNFGKPSRFGPLDRVCWGCIERLVGVRLFELDTCFWVEIDTQQTGQKNESDNCHIKKYIRYVHELRHALRLCGIEKEIII